MVRTGANMCTNKCPRTWLHILVSISSVLSWSIGPSVDNTLGPRHWAGSNLHASRALCWHSFSACWHKESPWLRRMNCGLLMIKCTVQTDHSLFAKGNAGVSMFVVMFVTSICVCERLAACVCAYGISTVSNMFCQYYPCSNHQSIHLSIYRPPCPPNCLVNELIATIVARSRIPFWVLVHHYL